MTDDELAILLNKYPYLQFVHDPDQPDGSDQMTSFLNDKHPAKILLSGNGRGKSTYAAWGLMREIYSNPAPEPNTPIWIISQNLDMSGSIYRQCIDKFLDKNMIQNIIWRKKQYSPEVIILKKDKLGNNFNIHFLSCEQGRAALQSANVWLVWCDEQTKPDIIEECLARLRRWMTYDRTSFMYTCTPLEPDAWLENLYENRNNEDVKHLWKFYFGDTSKNKHITEEWKKAYLDSLPPDIRLTRQYGQFASYRGCIYPEFTNDLIIVPKEVRGEKFIGLDFGFHHPAALWVIKINETYYVVDELQCEDLRADLFAEKVKTKWDHQWRLICDPEDPNSRQFFNAAGMPTTGALKSVLPGIELVKTLMWNKKLFVFENCKETVKQLKAYRWRESGKDKDAKEEPLKINDHLCDVLRYICYTNQKTKIAPWAQPPIPKSPRLLPTKRPVRFGLV